METDRREDDFFEVYTKDLTGEDVQRLLSRATPATRTGSSPATSTKRHSQGCRR
jgi:hypothetical protein